MDETTKKTIQEALGTRIKKRRTELGISQNELALQSNLHRSYIFSIEKGDHSITLESLFMLAKALRCHAKDLTTDSKKKNELSLKKKKITPEVDIEAILLEFGRLVKEKRLSQNISQDEFASRSGLHRTYISQIESGKRNISLENILIFAETFQCSPADLIPNLEIKLEKKVQVKEVKIAPIEKKALLKGFAKLIKEKRLKIDLSQEELGARSGLHRSYMSTLEQGKQNVSLENMYMLAKALNCQLRELIP